MVSPAEAGPTIARVALDVPLAHLDRFFDYAVPPAMREIVRPGVRVRARFAGRQVNGVVVSCPESSDAPGRLSPLSKVVSGEVVLTPEQVAVIRAVADHYCGVFADVLRLAVPPRHAATENAPQRPWPAPSVESMPPGGLLAEERGATFCARLGAGESVRAHWVVDPAFVGPQPAWVTGVVQAAVATLRAGRGVLVVVPDRRALDEARRGLAATVGAGAVAELHADLGPAARYRNYLAIGRGEAKVVVATRAGGFAPVHDLGLIVVVDDGNDLLAEPRAPYPHARDVAALRVATAGCGLLLVAHNRSAEATGWVERGWLVPIESAGAQRRRSAPLVRVSADSDQALERDLLAGAARLPRLVFETIRAGLAQGPVLVQVPRAGHLSALICNTCRTPLHCPHCNGPVRGRRVGGSRELSCGWCGRLVIDWRCPVCGGRQVRAPIVGSSATAEELGRAFPGFRLLDSSGDRVVAEVGEQPAIVVATPGAEPTPSTGYAALILLDAWLSLQRPDLRTGEESLRRWLDAMALVRGADEGGTVCVVGPSEDRVIQALVRVDPIGFAVRELADRAAAGYPPAVRFVMIDGDPASVQDFQQTVQLPASATVLGPIETAPEPEPTQRLLVQVPPADGPSALRAIKDVLGVRSARKAPGSLRVHVDPVAI